MKYVFNIGLVSSVIIAVGTGTWLYADIAPLPMHPMGSNCVECHLAGNNTVTANASLLVASQEVLCSQCHEDSMAISHISGITPRPEQKIPPTYPLDWKGELTCSTCHLVHSNAHGKLRGSARGEKLCKSCHSDQFFDDMSDGGTSLTSSGHLGAKIARGWNNLDQYSIQCMGCHTENGDVNISDNGTVSSHGALSHPVGRDYLRAAKAGGYHDVSRLSKKIKLPNGMVSCVSCHEAYSKAHGQLVISNNGSALCFECHDI